MISSFRNFAKTKFAGLLVFIMIIPFVFWGMGSMFSTGNTNNIAKINKKNISTQDFIEHIKRSKIPEQTIRENLDNNIIEELLSTLISTTLLEMEIKDFDITITEETLSEKIRNNKNFLNENGNFERMKYEKFLLENNQSAPSFELRLRGRELQKNLFDYIGSGVISPKFLTKKLFMNENRKLDIEYINLNKFYRNKETFNDSEIENFIEENKNELKIEYIDFEYATINPQNIIGSNEFNQAFFDKIDEIEIQISNNLDLKTILKNFNIDPIEIKNYRYSEKDDSIMKKIFELKENNYDLVENENNYIIFKINNSEQRIPDLSDLELKNEVLELIFQKNKFDFNRKLLKKINEKNFTNSDFIKMSENSEKKLTINSIKDNKKFEINSIELLYSLPINSYTLINDENGSIYLANIKDFKDKNIDINDKIFSEYTSKQNTNNKNSILKSYDLLLNKKYNVVLNQKTIERVKNFFQ